jgi:hypothetical protein
MNESGDRFNKMDELAELTVLVLGQIRELAKLHDEGILTNEEFTAKKQELLSRL